MSDKQISVCLFCYQAVIQLREGKSESILKSKCRVCGRVFLLETKIREEKVISFINESGEVSKEAWEQLGKEKISHGDRK